MSEDRHPGNSRRALRTERQSQTDSGQQSGYPAGASRPGSTGTATSAKRPPSRRRAADSPVDAQPARTSERESLARARDREALRAYKALAEQDNGKSQQPLTRRQLRQQQLEAERRAAGLSTSRQPIVPPANGSPAEPEADGASTQQQAAAEPAAAAGDTSQTPGAGASQLNNLSVEEALAARSALVEQAKNQMAMLEASGEQRDPRSVDLNVLAEQKKLAERAAVLNQRALAKQRLAEENQQRQAQPNDPAAAHNLAMVTPLEFVKIPGRELPVMKPPTTSHIPVITSTPAEASTASPEASKASTDTGAKIPPPPAMAPGTKDSPPSGSRGARSQEQAAPAGPGRSRVLARAEAVASTARPPAGSGNASDAVATRGYTEEGDPISAHTAHGLEPLDAMTAGLGRGYRLKLIQILVMAVGTIAIMVGLIMILGG